MSRVPSLRRPAALAAALLPCLGAVAAELAAPPPAGAETLEEIVVVSRVAKLYRVEETTVGRLPTEPLAAALSIQAIDADLIRDQGARTAQDLYRSLSGVSFFSYAGVTARGFRQEEIFFDGLRGDPYASFAVPELFNVERVEFLKGPASMLYGPGAPGGLFNYVTKQPTDESTARLRAIAGTESRLGASGEWSGPLPAGSARLGLFFEDRDLPRDNAGSRSVIADAGYRIDLGGSRLTLQAARYDQDLAGARLRGVPTDANGRFLADRRWNHNERSDFLRLESDVLQARWNASLGDSLAFDAGLRWNDALETQRYHEPFGLLDANRDGVPDATRRQFRDQRRDQQTWSAAANAVWTTAVAGVPTRVLAGADWFDLELDFSSRGANGGATTVAGQPPPLSLREPRYGLVDPASYLLSPTVRTPSSARRTGGYLLGEATFGPVIASGGLRRDDFEDTSGAARFEDAATSWRAGLVWRLRPDVSLYAQWATSFEPQGVSSQTPLAGGPFDPTEGEMIEGGVRTELLDGRVQGSLVGYRIVRTNILQADPRGDVGGDGVNDQVPFGEVTSRGVELDLAADVTENWVVTASYAYNDTKITRTNLRTAIVNSVGDRFANAPRHEAGFWTRYQFPGSGFAVALGGDYVDVRRSLSNQRVPAYLVFDASLISERGPWSALLRVNNLLDKTYAASGFSDRTGHFPGAPREAFVEISRRW